RTSLLTTPPPPRSTLFPYTTLFRSAGKSKTVRIAAAPRRRKARSGVPQRPIDHRARSESLPDRFDAPAPGYARRVTPLRALRRRSEEHTSELQSRRELVCRLLLEKK